MGALGCRATGCRVAAPVAPSEALELAPHGDRLRGEVDVVPSETESLTASEAEGKGERPAHRVAVTFRRFEKGGHLLDGVRVDVGGRVAGVAARDTGFLAIRPSSTASERAASRVRLQCWTEASTPSAIMVAHRCSTLLALSLSRRMWPMVLRMRTRSLR